VVDVFGLVVDVDLHPVHGPCEGVVAIAILVTDTCTDVVADVRGLVAEAPLHGEARAQWRRDNVDTLVREMDQRIKQLKPWVKFGISPFGIWRPGYPPQIVTSFDQYAMLYADARKWLREGWGDYHSPQLYWPIARTGQSYPVLLDWWVRENVRGRHLWPGNFTSRTFEGDPVPWTADEVIGQVYVTRGRPGATGNIHFSMKAFALDRDSLAEKLAREAYPDHALPPATPWLTR